MIVLFAYDGSDGAAAAIAAAGKLLDGLQDVDAVVLAVWEPLTVTALRATAFGGPLAVPSDVDELDEEAERSAQKLAEHGASIAKNAGLNARPLAIADENRVADAIAAKADELGADLMVLGARGLRGVSAFLGSVSQHVLQHAHRPVLVVPPPKEEDPVGAARSHV